LLGAGAFVWESLPPRTLIMATGAEGGANYELGIRYRDALASEGVELQLQPTPGSLDNLRKLRDARSGVSVGFIQGAPRPGKNRRSWSRSVLYSMNRYGSSAALVRARRDCRVDESRLAPKVAAGEPWRCR